MFGRKKDKSGLSVRTTKRDMISKMRVALETAEFKYKYDEANSAFMTGFMGDDLPIATHIIVSDVSLQFVCLLDLSSKPENFSKVAWDLNCINKQLAFGAFCLDQEDGMISFEYGLPYVEADYSTEFILSFIKILVSTVDKYDGDLKKIAETTPRSEVDVMYN